jgi:hypothetical protein
MSTKTIEIIVDPTGKIRVETKGFMGSACQDESRFIELALGKCVDEMLLPSYYSTYESTILNQRLDC